VIRLASACPVFTGAPEINEDSKRLKVNNR